MNLLPLTSPLYLRRLARECNALPDGFYADGVRYSRARLSRGAFQGYRPASFVEPGDLRGASVNPWRDLSGENLSDAYGRTVTASRAQRARP